MDHVDQGLSFLHCCSSRLPTPLHSENLFAKKLLTGRDGFPMLAPPVGVLMVSESEDWGFTS